MGEMFDKGEPAENVTVFVEGESITIDEDTTAAELRGMVGAENGEKATVRNEENEPVYINDDEKILDHVNAGDKISFSPDVEGPLFG